MNNMVILLALAWNVMLLPMAWPINDEAAIEHKLGELKRVIPKISVNAFEKYEYLLSRLNRRDLYSIKLCCDYYAEACVSAQEIITMPGLHECFCALGPTIKKIKATPGQSKRETYLMQEQKRLEQDKKAKIAIDPLHEKIIELLEVQVRSSYLNDINNKIAQWPQAKKEQHLTRERERITAISAIVDREYALWVDEMCYDEEYDCSYSFARKLKPEEKYTLLPYPSAEKDQESVE